MLPRKPTIFISYSHKDEPDPLSPSLEFRWLTFVKSHLSPAAEHDLIELWDDSRIDGGNEWREEIDRWSVVTFVFCLSLVIRFLRGSFWMLK
jgi:hypothetical protein